MSKKHRSRRPQRRSKSRFQKAVEETSATANEYHSGLSALSNADRQRIDCSNPQILTGSVNLDAAIRQRTEPNSPVWDYGVGVLVAASNNAAEVVHWIEVHPANSSHVDNVIRKLEWLKKWLQKKAPKLDQFERRVLLDRHKECRILAEESAATQTRDEKNRSRRRPTLHPTQGKLLKVRTKTNARSPIYL